MNPWAAIQLCAALVALTTSAVLIFEEIATRDLANFYFWCKAVNAVAWWLAFVSDFMTEGFTWFRVMAGVWAVLATWSWWRGGGGRRSKKALRELGAKSVARVAALVERMSPSPIPVPGGAS